MHDAGMKFDVRRRRHDIHERHQIGRAADLLKMAAALQFIAQQQQINLVSALVQLQHGLENFLVARAVKIGGMKDFQRLEERVVIEQNRA